MSEINCNNCAICDFKESLCHWCDEMKRLGSAEDIEKVLISTEWYNKMAERLTELEYKEAERQWILCSERLPKTNGRYIVTRGLKTCNAIWNRVYVINYSNLMGLEAEKIWWNGNVGKSDFQKIDDVIAWMPLPEPYKGEDE